ncbi:Phospholipase/carboxylesterase/thioesterase [Boletus edulis]|nr:Phospholipase/carboxylesterase/thioesterase [Boletus edulis]
MLASSGAIIIPATAGHSATVVALHRTGGQGEEWLTLIGPGLRDCFPWVKPLRPITVHGGEVMRAWYDLSTFDLESDSTHDESGVFETVRYLDNIIQQEMDIGIPPSRTVLMGFSQGAGMVLLTALTGRGTRGRSKDDGWKLAGIVPLSGRVPLRSKFKSLASPYVSETPIFWAHGEEDAVVKYQYGLTCAEMLVNEMAVPTLERRELGSPGLCFVTYSGLVTL